MLKCQLLQAGCAALPGQIHQPRRLQQREAARVARQLGVQQRRGPAVVVRVVVVVVGQRVPVPGGPAPAALAVFPACRAWQMLLATSPDAIQLKKKRFKMRIDDVVSNMYGRPYPSATAAAACARCCSTCI